MQLGSHGTRTQNAVPTNVFGDNQFIGFERDSTGTSRAAKNGNIPDVKKNPIWFDTYCCKTSHLEHRPSHISTEHKSCPVVTWSLCPCHAAVELLRDRHLSLQDKHLKPLCKSHCTALSAASLPRTCACHISWLLKLQLQVDSIPFIFISAALTTTEKPCFPQTLNRCHFMQTSLQNLRQAYQISYLGCEMKLFCLRQQHCQFLNLILRSSCPSN